MPLAALGPILIGAAGTSAAATAGAWTAIATGATIGANIWGAKKQVSAQQNAAQIQADSARETARIQADAAAKATDAQTKANEATLAWQKQQATYGAQSTEVDRHANYDQWAAQQRRLGSIGEMVGLGQREIPGYVASPAPNFDTPGTPGAAAAPTGPMPTVDWNAPDAALGQQLSSYFKSRGAADTEVPYWIGKRAELVQRGKELNDPQYANKRLSVANIFGGAPAASASAPAKTTASPYRSVGDYLISPSASTAALVRMAPALSRPAPLQSVGSYL